jgi:hypothetical protein
MKREVIERVQETQRKSREEAELAAMIAERGEFVRRDYLLPDFTPDMEWMWTIVALVLWCFATLFLDLSPQAAVIGGLVVIYTWKYRRPWRRGRYDPSWRGWPDL